MSNWPRHIMSSVPSQTVLVYCNSLRRLCLMHESLHQLIRRALLEDGAEADITTLCTVPAGQQASGVIVTRQAGVIAGLGVAAETFQLFDPRISAELLVEDG